jgi:hypothetical protein
MEQEYGAGSKEQEAESREQQVGIGSRKQKAGSSKLE